MLGIRDILFRIRMRIRILRSVPLTNRSGCGSGTLAHFHHSPQIKSPKKDTKKQRKSRAGNGSESVLVTNGSGCGSATFKKMISTVELI
jgi:hypothetical protein